MSMSHSEFKFVERKKRRGYRKTAVIKSECDKSEDIDKEDSLRRLAALRREIVLSQFYKSSLQCLSNAINSTNEPKAEKLICFGIGPFGSNLIALHQLAFILEIGDELDIKDVQFYDPILSTIEEDILKQIGCNLIEENCEGKYRVESTTVFFLPHCPKQMTNNLLWSNWQPESLQKIILIGNSFTNMTSNMPKRFLEKDADYILRIVKHVTEVPLMNNYKFEDIFNDTSVHTFRRDDLERLAVENWKQKPEPSYQDTELVTRQLEKCLNIS